MTYSYAALGLKVSGASAGISADPKVRGESVEAFGANLADAVGDRRVFLDAAKGVSEADLAPLRVLDTRHTMYFDPETHQALTNQGVLAAAAWAHGPLDSNISAFWVPDRLPAPGTPLELHYRLHWTQAPPTASAVAPVIATHVGTLPAPLGRLFWIDFAGADIARRDNGALDAEIQIGPGARLLGQSVRKNSADASWRVAIEVLAEEPGRAVELRLSLIHI